MNRKDRRAAGKTGGTAAASPMAALFSQAVRHHQSGQLAEAEALYRRVLSGDRNHFGSLHHLGIIALQRGQPQAAVEPLGRAVALDSQHPECHYNLAFALQSVGRANDAIGPYQNAVRLKPDYVDAHTNLGNVLTQLGRFDEAIACYERVIKLKPSAETHCNLANVLARSGRLDDAVKEFQRALALKPDLVAAHNNLANALAAQSRHDEALTHFQRALMLDPRLAEAHVNIGNILLLQGKHDEALSRFARALEINPNFADAHLNLGTVFQAQGRLGDAAQSYQRALAIKPDLPEASNNLGIVLLAQGDIAQAGPRFQFAISRKPDFVEAYNNLARTFLAAGQAGQALESLQRALTVRETPETKSLFVQCVRALDTPTDSAGFRALLVRAMSEPWGRASELAAATAKLLKQGNAGAAIRRAAGAWPQRLPAPEMFGDEGLAAVAGDPLLRCLLESTTVADLDLERFLTSLRGALLKLVSDGDGATPDDGDTLALACALARQCFINEQVFARTDDEAALSAGLRERIAAELAGGEVSALRLAVLGCYLPLHSVPGIEAILDRPWPAALADVLNQQVREPATERTLRATIPALTPIENDVSVLVRQQYEENPYPRWVRTDLPRTPLPLDQYLRVRFPMAPFRSIGKAEPDVLIAGCGTGQHAIETAQRFAGARVLAIDLSLTSLAYALRKTRELGIGNIEYAQADILKLDTVGRSFDLIESSGVLHHMADPFAGWRTLLSVLRPGGVMAVALYSEIARADIVKARSFIAERRYGSSADDIRRCRQEIVAHEDGAAFRNVYASGDFFSTSDCRDLLFHVQEHRLTIPQIARFVADNALEFKAFEVAPAIASQYRSKYPADMAMTDLEAWDSFEREHPSTFSGMYQFWVQKAP